MDPITILGIVSNVVQIIDFGLRATSKAREIHTSFTGVLRGNRAIETLANDIETVIIKLESSDAPLIGNQGLEEICRQCAICANELLDALEKLKGDGAIRTGYATSR